MAKKNKTPSYVLTLRLETLKHQEDMLNKRFEISRMIYNACLGEANKRYRHLKRSRIYKTKLNELVELHKKIANVNARIKTFENAESPDKKKLSDAKKELKTLTSFKKEVSKTLSDLRLSYGLSEYQLHEFVGPMNRHFKGNMDIYTAQKIASRAFGALEKVMYSDGKKVHFKKFGQLDSVEGKSNKSGIRFKNNAVHWLRLEMPARIRTRDIYAQEALATSRIKYCRIVRKMINGKWRFFVQLVLEGQAPIKRDPDGSFKRKYGNSQIGIDPSLQSIAVASSEKVALIELAPSVGKLDKDIRCIQRYLDRSKRVTNPNKFNNDGTIKRNNKDKWIYSKSYMKALYHLKDLNRKRSILLKQEHNILANELLSIGTDIFVEKMNFKALAKRSKKTEISEKTGRYKRKKRFGKSISTKAPAMFFNILDNKLKRIDKQINYINTFSFKASQYDHIDDTYIKKSLSQRWTTIGSKKVQRDLYSAFLIMNSCEDLQHTDRQKCLDTFDNFIKLHDIEIENIKNAKNLKLFSSFGIKRAA